jgi:quinol monooxygenase YgiN
MTVDWLVPMGETRAIAAALHALMAAARESRGCVSCSMSTGISDRGSVRYTEEWETEADLRRRLQSEAFLPLASLIEDVTGTTHVEFDLPCGKRGLEFVYENRSA